jgi:hypothetical protein
LDKEAGQVHLARFRRFWFNYLGLVAKLYLFS